MVLIILAINGFILDFFIMYGVITYFYCKYVSKQNEDNHVATNFRCDRN